LAPTLKTSAAAGSANHAAISKAQHSNDLFLVLVIVVLLFVVLIFILHFSDSRTFFKRFENRRPSTGGIHHAAHLRRPLAHALQIAVF
jgi:hypothetical protein